MTKEQIDHIVSRFLSWTLPDDFSPDDGISFEKVVNAGSRHERVRQPTGTNLFNFPQARAMVLHMLTGLPEGEGEPDRELTKQEIAFIDDAWETHKAAGQ